MDLLTDIIDLIVVIGCIVYLVIDPINSERKMKRMINESMELWLQDNELKED